MELNSKNVLNLVYYLVNEYVNMDTIYFGTKQFNHNNKLIRCDIFLTISFVLK